MNPMGFLQMLMGQMGGNKGGAQAPTGLGEALRPSSGMPGITPPSAGGAPTAAPAGNPTPMGNPQANPMQGLLGMLLGGMR